MKQIRPIIISSVIAVFFGVAVLSGHLVSSESVSGGHNKEIRLPAPNGDGRTSVEKALHERRSVREFKSMPMALSDLSQLLWAAQGITGNRGQRTAPSAGALYPLELYVLAGSVNGLEPGIYLYKPGTHGLQPIVDGDRRQELSSAALGQPAIKNASAVLVIAGVFERTTIKYGERGNRYVHLEAGHAAQNVYLQAVSLDLGTVAIGAFDDAAVKKIAGLTVREQPLYLMPIGKPSAR